MNNRWLLIIFKAFKFGLIFNISTLICAIIYVVAVEKYFQPFDGFKSFIELGTTVAGYRIYNTADPENYELRPAWKDIESKFDLFVPEFQLRPDWSQPAVRLENWCRNQKCCAHRIGFNDSRISNFKCFTLDDWYISNRDFLGSELESSVIALLDGFLRSLPPRSRVIVSEPFVLFSDRRTFRQFTLWVFDLKRKYPDLEFEIGIQVHLQWLDNYWVKYGWLFPALGEFSSQFGIPWGISEFSIYDRVWKRRLSFAGEIPKRAKSIERLEAFIPERFRCAIVSHQAYLIHKSAVSSGARFSVLWGNFPTLWFSDRIDADYRSTFALFDWDGSPQMMWWAIARGVSR